MTESNSENPQGRDKEGKQNSTVEADAKAWPVEHSSLSASLATSDSPYSKNRSANNNASPFKLLHDATTRCGLNRIFLPFFEPVPTYAFTALVFDEGTTVPLPDLNTFQNLEFPSQDELIQDSTSHINKCVASSTKNPFDDDLQEMIGIANEPAIHYSNIDHEKLSHPGDVTSSSYLPLVVKTFGFVGGYESTGHTCDESQISNSHINTPTPSLIDRILPLEAKYSHTQTDPYPDTLQVCAGSFTDSSIEATMPFTTEHMLEKPQMEEWLHQTSAEAMTLAEQMEMNRHTWAECL